MTALRAITVHQPYAWAILHGGKTIENRARISHHRGPVAIHAGTRWSDRGASDPRVKAAAADAHRRGHHAPEPGPASGVLLPNGLPMGKVIGVVDIADCHPVTPGCCDDPWADHDYNGTAIGAHLVLANPRALADPIRVRGQLGLWTLTAAQTADVGRQLAEHTGAAS